MKGRDREPITDRVERMIREFGDPIYGLADAETHKYQGSGSDRSGRHLSTSYRLGNGLVIVETHEGCVEPWEPTSLFWLYSPEGEITFPWTITVKKSLVTWVVDDAPTEARVLHIPTRWVGCLYVGERFVEVKAFGVPFDLLRLRALARSDVRFLR